MHSFFSNTNLVLFFILAAAMAADGYSTQRFLSPEVEARHNNDLVELNPIARPFVNKGMWGQAFISGIGFLFVIGMSAIFHHFGHHWLERLPIILVAEASGYLAYRNMQF